MASDEEEYILQNGGVVGEEMFGFGDAFVNAPHSREGGAVFVQRRRGGGMFLPSLNSSYV